MGRLIVRPSFQRIRVSLLRCAPSNICVECSTVLHCHDRCTEGYEVIGIASISLGGLIHSEKLEVWASIFRMGNGDQKPQASQNAEIGEILFTAILEDLGVKPIDEDATDTCAQLSTVKGQTSGKKHVLIFWGGLVI